MKSSTSRTARHRQLPRRTAATFTSFSPITGLLSYTFDGKERWRTPAGTVRQHLRNGRVAHSGRRQGGFDLRPAVTTRSPPRFPKPTASKPGRRRGPKALSGHSTPIVYRPRGGAPGRRHPNRCARFVPPGCLRSGHSGKSVWWVNGLASEMKSVPVLDGDTVYINGFNSPFNDPGKHIEIPSFADALAKYDANHDGAIAASGTARWPHARLFSVRRSSTTTESWMKPNGSPSKG